MEQLKNTGELIASYLAAHWGCTCELEHIEQIPGGASRQTYLVRLIKAGQPVGVVVRRDPTSSLIDTERAHEYKTYQAVYEHGVMPVPEPIALEEQPGALERPFSIMALVSAGQAGAAGLDDPAMQSKLAKLGQQKWTLLGQLGKLSPASLGVDRFMSVPEHAAAHELAYWKQVIETDALHPQPIAAAALLQQVVDDDP